MYWDDMNDKYGFNDGSSIPRDAELARQVYVQALNVLAARNGSQVRAIAWDRPGVHNWCLIVMVPLTFFEGLSPEQVLGQDEVKLPDGAKPSDEKWDDAVADALDMGLDDYIISTPTLDPKFSELLITLQEGR